MSCGATIFVNISVDLTDPDDDDMSTIRTLVDDLIRQCDEVSTINALTNVGASPTKTAVRKSNRGRVEQAATDEERNGAEDESQHRNVIHDRARDGHLERRTRRAARELRRDRFAQGREAASDRDFNAFATFDEMREET